MVYIIFSKVKAEQLEKQQTPTKVLSFQKYINYNTPTRAISHLYNHLTLGPMALVLSDYKCNIALVGML